jgi:hypothetical protein
MDRDNYTAQLGADQQRRWSRVLAFLDEWDRPLRRGDGLPLAQVEAAERSLGVRLPAALREWYLLSGKRSSDEEIVGETLRAPEDLVLYGGALVFYDEPQGTVRWGILEADLALDDPPVVIEGMEEGYPGPVWSAQNRSLTEFIFQMEVMYTILFAELSAIGYCDKAGADMVMQQFQSLGLPDWYWPEYPTRLLSGPDLLVELVGSGEDRPGSIHIHTAASVHICSRSEPVLQDAIRRLHMVQWRWIKGKDIGP